ncbi:MAG TPA: ABC transporter permease [Gaiellaceae bacterium]|nr:ABC transporter permease [Gaiellaceae bacterium]
MSQAENFPPESPEEAALSGTLAASLSLRQRAGGFIVPLITVVIAFLMSGFVVLATGHNPLLAYRDIFDGAGLNWIFHPTTNLASTAAYNLTQTLLQTTTLILTGLAVAFAFRCGMFNIGGQGQYFIGLIVANWLGYDFAHMSPFPHILICIVAATLAGAAYAGIAGFLKATVGAHEVITTIMLNWVAIWVGSWLFGDGGPLQNASDKTVPISNDVADSAKLPVFWGQQLLQGLDIGIFIAIAALVVFWALLNRTTTGYEVRAVGFNPESAAYGGINVKKNLIRAMAISGAFAGLAGALDMLGYLYHYGQNDIPLSSVGFLGIAVALLGRNTAVGVGLGALLFGALLFGTTHGLTSTVIKPELAGNLTYIIQGLVVLFIGADVLILYIWNSRRKLRRPRGAKAAEAATA